MTIANTATAPLGISAKSAPRAKVRRPQRVEDLLEEGSISYAEWKKTPTALAIKKWEEEHPEEAAQIEAEVLKEMGLA